MTDRRRPDRQAVIDMLADYRAQVSKGETEDLDSLELAWLVHQAEQRYGVELDPADTELSRMYTVSGAAAVLAEMIGGRGDG